jgi:uncharacterized membrane protein YfcA
MDYIVICTIAFLVSGLTLFAGFGLGTMLLPAFAIFFPIEIAVALTAVVHLLNNIFKLSLLGKYADKSVVLRFGIPAILTAYLGARLLIKLSDLNPIYAYEIFERQFQIMPVKLVIAFLMIIFALFEIIPLLNRISFGKKMLPVGGILSGFFGGLSGHQGALRSAFLLRTGLTKEAFIATGIVIACIIDISRLFVYTERFAAVNLEENYLLLVAATLSAFLGAYLGRRLLKKITMTFVQVTVSVLLFLIAIGLALGII